MAGEGYLRALQVMSGIASYEQQQAAARQQAFDQREQERINSHTEGVLSQVFREGMARNNEQDWQTSMQGLAQQYQTAGQQLMGWNPKLGMAFMQQAEKTQTNALQSQKRELDVTALREKYVTSALAGATDQESWDQAQKVAARYGQPIPADMQQWTPKAQAWASRRAALAVPVEDAMRMQQQMFSNDMRQKEYKLKLDQEDRHKKTADAAAAQARDSAERQKTGLRLRMENQIPLHKTQQSLMSEIAIMEDADPNNLFDDLPDGLKLQAARDVPLRARKLLKAYSDAGQELSAEEAMNLARTSIFGELSKGGEGSGLWADIKNQFAATKRTIAESDAQPATVADQVAPQGAPAAPTNAVPLPMKNGKVDVTMMLDGQTYITREGVLRYNAATRQLVRE